MIPELIQRGKKGQAVRTRDLEPSLAEKHGTLRNVSEVERLDSDTKARRLREEAKVEEVRKKAIGRGHSTPVEVGTFARDIRARRLVINHFSCM
jgi:ribonuclease Z